MSTSMATEALGMPVPGSRRAPDFDSRNPEELKEFLEEFEELAEKFGLTMREKAKIVVVREHSEVSQNTLDYSRGGVLS